jgi:hypothetical protein
MTTSIKEIEETTAGNITPEFYYRWGDEPAGYASTGLYLDDVWHNTGHIPINEAMENLKYHCPYN